MPNRPAAVSIAVFVALVAVAAGSRFAWIAPNFAAVSAAALFAGFYFRSRLAAAAVPLIAMVLSDLALGTYPVEQMIAVYACLTLPILMGRAIGTTAAPLRIAGWSLLASCIFFLVTNFAVWLGGVYGMSAAGLAACYIATLPFFKYTLAGDLLYAGMFFGAYETVRVLRTVRAAAVA